MKALYKKELIYYFNNIVGYVIAFLFAVFANFMFMKDLFLRGDSSMRPFFDTLPWIILIFIPALSMKVFSEEKKVNTFEVLMTLPISEKNIVLAKFLNLLTFSSLCLALTFSIPFTLFIIGKVYWPVIITSYLGTLMLIASFIALSMYFSSLTKNQVVSYLFSVLFCFLLTMLGSNFLAGILSGLIQKSITYLSPIYHYENFLKGLLDIRSVFYFISFVVLMLFLTITNLEKRK